MLRRGSFRSPLVLFAVLVLGSVVPPARTAAAAPAVTGDLAVLSVTDVKGKTGPCGCHTPKGGLARQASFADSVRALHPRLVWLDNGGFFPEVAGQEDVADFLVQMMSNVGIAAANVGARDLSYGRSFLVSRAKQAGLALVSANLTDRATKQPAFEAWRMIDADGVKVGVFGVAPDTMNLGPSRDSLLATDPVAAATKAVAALRAKGASVIVCLSQLGKFGSESLVEAVPGIDLLVVGHDVPVIQQGRVIGSTLAVYGGEQGQYMARSILTLDARGRVTGRSGDVVPLSPDVGDNPAVLRTVQGFDDARAAREREKAAPKP